MADAGLTTVDVWQNFPDSQGENGFFAYGYAPATGSYRLLSDGGSYWFNTPQTQWDAPSMGRYSDHLRMWASGTRSNTGTPEDSVLAWIVPEAASYQVSGTWYINPASENGMDTYVKYNDTTLWASRINANGTRSFNVTASLDVNDVIYFGVNAHNTGSFSELNDGAWLYSAQIVYETAPTGVPTPHVMLLFSTGLVSLIAVRRAGRAKRNPPNGALAPKLAMQAA